MELQEIMNKKRLIFCIIICSVYLCVACGQKQELHENVPEVSSVLIEVPTSEMTKESNCIIQVQTDYQCGSGVLWDSLEETWIFVTAGHVVENQESVEIYFPEENKICVANVRNVEDLDLAFLRLNTEMLTAELINKYGTCFKKMDDNTKESVEDETQLKCGEIISAIGYSASAETLEYMGTVREPWIYVEDFDNYMILCECEAYPGMSGGGVFTEDGRLVGIVCGQNEEGLLAVLPVAVIEAQYNLFMNY